MRQTYLIAAAPISSIHTALLQLRQEGLLGPETIMLTTRKQRFNEIEHYEDLAAEHFSENSNFRFAPNSQVIVIQYRETLISYINVYRFLHHNGVQDFAIKVTDKDLIESSIERVFDFIGQNKKGEGNPVIWVEPDKIQLRKEFPQAKHGAVEGGDWDRDCMDFERSVSFYHGAKERFVQAKPWTETLYYQDILTSLKQGEERFGCKTQEDLDSHCEQLDALYADMQQNGWRQANESDYVSVNIGREGQLIFNDGRHRLVIARLLRLPAIPVKVAVRHSEWKRLKSEIQLYADTHYAGNLYNKLEHPDLASFGITQHDDRLEYLVKALQGIRGTALDIGSHWGYFCGELEKRGFRCTAVEADIGNYYFLEKLRTANGYQFIAVNQSIFDFVSTPMKFNIVLALNIFHHFLKTEALYNQLQLLLKRLSMDVLILQTHSSDEPQMQGAFMNPNGREFAKLIAKFAGLGTVDCIKEYDNGRMIFRLSC